MYWLIHHACGLGCTTADIIDYCTDDHRQIAVGTPVLGLNGSSCSVFACSQSFASTTSRSSSSNVPTLLPDPGSTTRYPRQIWSDLTPGDADTRCLARRFGVFLLFRRRVSVVDTWQPTRSHLGFSKGALEGRVGRESGQGVRPWVVPSVSSGVVHSGPPSLEKILPSAARRVRLSDGIRVGHPCAAAWRS
eukprot:scaffold1720_cov353-Pavlova_lutheri.AAC.15